MSSSVKRNANIELLRILSMLMVTMLHALGKSGALESMYTFGTPNSIIAWIFEALSISAVNIFFLISGYFLIKSSFKLSRLIEIIFQVVFYTAISLGIGIAAGLVTGSDLGIYTLLNNFLPIHMDVYWFITVYVVIYMLSPIISAGVNAISKKQFQTALIVLIIYECSFKSLLPFKLEADKSGYTLLWGLTVFLTGAYIRLYGIPILNSFKRGIFLYFAASLACLTEETAIRYIYASSGRLENIVSLATSYNHLFVFAAATGIFIAFLHKKEITGIKEKIILFLSPMTLGVYLIQENYTFRYEWMKWLGINDSFKGSAVSFAIHLIAGVLLVYLAGTFIDYIRIKIFKLVKTVFNKK